MIYRIINQSNRLFRSHLLPVRFRDYLFAYLILLLTERSSFIAPAGCVSPGIYRAINQRHRRFVPIFRSHSAMIESEFRDLAINFIIIISVLETNLADWVNCSAGSIGSD